MELPPTLQKAIQKHLKQKTGIHEEIHTVSSVGGGCINDTMKIVTSSGAWFLKINDSRFAGMFETELKGLNLLRDTATVYVPEPLGCGETDDGTIFLLMEFVEGSPSAADYWEQFGRQLALMHKHSADQFGLDFDNYIGSLPQSNKKHNTWEEFFIEERIEKQLELAINAGKLPDKTVQKLRNLYPRLDEIFPTEPPALLHGDLWGGNVMTGPGGCPCIMDPAVYFGHREVDLAFSGMFGSFPDSFYQTYNETYPLAPGFDKRKEVYNLYPILVHVNIFGTSYVSALESVLNRF